MPDEGVDIIVPKWGLTMEEASISEWLVQVGEQVAEGDPLVEIETDKVVNEVESPVAGTVSEILSAPGTEVEPGDVIGRITPS